MGCHFLLPTTTLCKHKLVFRELEGKCKGQFSSDFQSCPTFSDPTDYSPPGSSVCGISQARILEWVAISSFPSPGDLPNPGKISVQISLQDSPFNSFRYIFRIAGSYGNSVFNFWRSCQIAFHRGYTTLHSHQQCTRVPVSPYPCQH